MNKSNLFTSIISIGLSVGINLSAAYATPISRFSNFTDAEVFQNRELAIKMGVIHCRFFLENPHLMYAASSDHVIERLVDYYFTYLEWHEINIFLNRNLASNPEFADYKNVAFERCMNVN